MLDFLNTYFRVSEQIHFDIDQSALGGSYGDRLKSEPEQRSLWLIIPAIKALHTTTTLHNGALQKHKDFQVKVAVFLIFNF